MQLATRYLLIVVVGRAVSASMPTAETDIDRMMTGLGLCNAEAEMIGRPSVGG